VVASIPNWAYTIPWAGIQKAPVSDLGGASKRHLPQPFECASKGEFGKPPMMREDASGDP